MLNFVETTFFDNIGNSIGVEITIGRCGGGKPNVCNLGFSGYRFAIELVILYLNCLKNEWVLFIVVLSDQTLK